MYSARVADLQDSIKLSLQRRVSVRREHAEENALEFDVVDGIQALVFRHVRPVIIEHGRDRRSRLVRIHVGEHVRRTIRRTGRRRKRLPKVLPSVILFNVGARVNQIG